MAWTAILTRQGYEQQRTTRSAMAGPVGEIKFSDRRVDTAVQGMAQSLLLELPGVDWTIEVDYFGHHRITLHFKGLGLQVD